MRPMVLHWRRCGRAGGRQNQKEKVSGSSAGCVRTLKTAYTNLAVTCCGRRRPGDRERKSVVCTRRIGRQFEELSRGNIIKWRPGKTGGRSGETDEVLAKRTAKNRFLKATGHGRRQEPRGQVKKGAGRMPWHWEPMKDAISCEKPRGAAHEP